jgi:hypothetical protein
MMSVTQNEDGTFNGLPSFEQLAELHRIFNEHPPEWSDGELASRIAEDRPQLNLDTIREACDRMSLVDTTQDTTSLFNPAWVMSREEVRRVREREYQRYMNARASQATDRIAGEWAADRPINGHNPLWGRDAEIAGRALYREISERAFGPLHTRDPVPEMTEEPKPAYLKLSDISEMFIDDLMVKMAIPPANTHIVYESFSTYVSHHFPENLLVSYIDEALDEFINNEQREPRKIVAPEAIILRIMQLQKFRSLARITHGYLKANVRSCIQIRGFNDRRPSDENTVPPSDIYAGGVTIRLQDPGF